MADILIASLLGSDYRNAAYTLGQSFHTFTSNLHVDFFISSTPAASIEAKFQIAKSVGAYELGYYFNSWQGFANVNNFSTYLRDHKVDSELNKLLLQNKYKVIISTDLSLTERLIAARARMNLDKLKIISCVPGFDLTRVLIPDFKSGKPDGLLAQSSYVLDKLRRRWQLSESVTHLSGFMPRDVFSKITSFAEAKKYVASKYKAIAVDKFTVILMGGQFWVAQAYNLIKKMLNDQDLDWQNLQVVVVSNNTKNLERYSKLRDYNPDKSIIPIQLTDTTVAANLYQAADATILANLNISHLSEIMAAAVAPVFINTIDPDTERANLEYVLREKIVSYMKNKGHLLTEIARLQGDAIYRAQQNEVFRDRAGKYLQQQSQTAQAMVELIQSMIG